MRVLALISGKQVKNRNLRFCLFYYEEGKAQGRSCRSLFLPWSLMFSLLLQECVVCWFRWLLDDVSQWSNCFIFCHFCL